MRFFRLQNVALALALLGMGGYVTMTAPIAVAQTTTTGDITGVITDTSGAVIAGATVVLTSENDGSKRTIKTSAEGSYRFSLLQAGNYTVKLNMEGLTGGASHIQVSTGRAIAINITAKPSSVNAEITVLSSSQPQLQTEDANITTTLDSQAIQDLPVPGGDISTLAFTAPGINLSTGGGYGGFTAFGLPATENLYTLNGNDMMDPYLNLNNSGASNLSLGANEISDVAIVNNGYNAQYGRYPGTQVNYTTQSGGNSFHGNLKHFYNGTLFNANDYIAKMQGTDRPHAVSNQWAGSVGGPILRDKLFFFFDTEGMRYVLPGGGTVYLPSEQFMSDVIANVTAKHPEEAAYYKTIQSLYAGAPGVSRAKPVTGNGNCGMVDGTTINGTLYGDSAASCTRTFRSTVNNMNTEALWAARADQVIGANDHMSYRVKHDWGIQATSTDPINSAFSANSVQPSWEGQINESHSFGTTVANNLILSGSYYQAIFGPPDYEGAIKLFPTEVDFSDGLGFASLGGADYSYPSGRDVTQLQFIDDLSWIRGKHSLKFGINYRYDKISDFTNQAGKSGDTVFGSLLNFAEGEVDGDNSYVLQKFPAQGQKAELYPAFGIYAQDEWAVTDHLKLVLSLRTDHSANIACAHGCFARLTENFPNLTHDAAVAYNKVIDKGEGNLFKDSDFMVWQPRAGFSYAPQGQSGRFDFRGGIGLFSDTLPGVVSRRFLANAPNVASFTYTDVGLADPTLSSGTAYSALAASSKAFQSGFTSGENYAQIAADVAAQGASFSAPTYYTAPDHFKATHVLQWNFEAQIQLSHADVLDLNYVGNSTWNSVLVSQLDNAYSKFGVGGLPTSKPDTRFGTVIEYTNNGKANYNGLTTSYRHQAKYGLTLSANYTYSKALDRVSNGGIEGFNLNQTYPLEQLAYGSASKLNHGLADYDIRNSSSIQYDWKLPFHSSKAALKYAVEGWQVSGDVYYRGGYPISILNSDVRTNQSIKGNSSTFLAALTSGKDHTCSARPNKTDISTQVCFKGDTFATVPTTSVYTYGFGNIARNSFSTPHYFNSDLQLNKNTKIREKYNLKIGANFYNVLNHANFAPPVNNTHLGDFGAIESTVTPPSSPYGSFMGSAVSGRIIQVLSSFSF